MGDASNARVHTGNGRLPQYYRTDQYWGCGDSQPLQYCSLRHVKKQGKCTIWLEGENYWSCSSCRTTRICALSFNLKLTMQGSGFPDTPKHDHCLSRLGRSISIHQANNDEQKDMSGIRKFCSPKFPVVALHRFGQSFHADS